MKNTREEVITTKLETEKRVFIAEFCGWKRETKKEPCWYGPDGLIYNQAPDYFNDLNAIHGVVMSLCSSQRDMYNMKLTDMVCTQCEYSELSDIDEAINATATQRAEAFLEVAKIWTRLAKKK